MGLATSSGAARDGGAPAGAGSTRCGERSTAAIDYAALWWWLAACALPLHTLSHTPSTHTVTATPRRHPAYARTLSAPLLFTGASQFTAAMADAIQQDAAAAAESLSVATSRPDACVDVRTLMDVVKTSAVELAFATRYQIAEDALEAAISSGRSVALVHPGRDAFGEKNAPRSWSFDPTIAKAKVKRGKGSGHLRSQLERDLGGFIAVFLGSAIKGSNAPDMPAATLLKPLRDEFVEAVMKEVASMQRRLDRRDAQASVPADLSAAAQAVDTRLFGPELERLLTGDAADPEILHKAVEILMTFPAVKQMMIAGGSPRVQKAGAAGSMQKEAERSPERRDRSREGTRLDFVESPLDRWTKYAEDNTKEAEDKTKEID